MTELEWLKETGRLRMYKSVYEVEVNTCTITNVSSILEAWVSKAIGYMQKRQTFSCLLLIAFLQIAEGWLEFPWTFMANEIIWRQMRIIMPFFISTSLLNLSKQKLFFYWLYYFSGPSQMMKWNPGKVILIIIEYKTYFIWAAFTSLIHSTSHWLDKHP